MKTMRGKRLRAWSMRFVVTAMLAGLGVVGIVVARAAATTFDGVGLPEPTIKVPDHYGEPFDGRFFVSEVARKGRIVAGELDVALQEEAREPFFYGELELRMYDAGGRQTTVVESLYPFQYANGHMSAGLVPNETVTPAKPYGVTIGHISFVEPTGKDAENPRQLTAEMTFNGRGPYRIAFKRGNDSHPPPNPLPRARQIGA
jgi:hypothetical protein